MVSHPLTGVAMLIALSTAVVLMLPAACNRAPSAGTAATAPRPWSLVATGDTAGWIAPCGCTTKQAGGLARRAAVIRELRGERETIVVDVGGAAGGVSTYDQLKFTAILRGEVAMEIAAHNIGKSEAALSAETLRRIAKDVSVPFLSSNLRDASGNLVAPALRIATAGGRRVAISGVIAPSLVADLAASSSPGETLQASEPVAAVLEALRGAKDQYDIAVVLAYLPAEELAALARALPEVDLVIGGPTRQTIPAQTIGPVLMTAVTNQGKFLARLDAPTNRAGGWDARIVELDATLADDPVQLKNLHAFRQELARRDLPAIQTSFAPALSAAAGDEFRIVGSQACRDCHAQDHTIWHGSAHAAAWQTLVERKRKWIRTASAATPLATDCRADSARSPPLPTAHPWAARAATDRPGPILPIRTANPRTPPAINACAVTIGRTARNSRSMPIGNRSSMASRRRRPNPRQDPTIRRANRDRPPSPSTCFRHHWFAAGASCAALGRESRIAGVIVDESLQPGRRARGTRRTCKSGLRSRGCRRHSGC